MSKSRKSSKKKGLGNINFSILLIIIILLAIFSYALTFLFIDDASNEEQLITSKPNLLKKDKISKDGVKIMTPINGSWYSTYDGAILTIDGTNIKIETPSVDNPKVIKGTIKLVGNEVTFNYESSSKTCAGVPGKYHWEIENQKKLIFTIINDNCKNRAERMSAPWERL